MNVKLTKKKKMQKLDTWLAGKKTFNHLVRIDTTQLK